MPRSRKYPHVHCGRSSSRRRRNPVKVISRREKAIRRILSQEDLQTGTSKFLLEKIAEAMQ